MTTRLAIVLTERYADWECGLLMATARPMRWAQKLSC